MTVCAICESPHISAAHFGARSCKACAAFFRRTIVKNLKYDCHARTRPCKVHYELRNNCRFCRFGRCLLANMRAELVQGTKSAPLSNDWEKFDFSPYAVICPTIATTSQIQIQPMLNYESISAYQNALNGARMEINNFSEPKKEAVALETSEAQPNFAMTSSPSDESFSFSSAEKMTWDHNLDDDWDMKIDSVIDQFIQMEATLNDRRRIMFADFSMRDVFKKPCHIPYDKRDLRPFDYRTYRVLDRYEMIMIFDCTRTFPGYENLLPAEKNILFRFTAGVDHLLAAAYYSSQLGMEEKMMILGNGMYIKMDPLPISGEELNAESHFSSREDFDKYRSLMPLKLAQWKNVCLPLHQLNLSFAEYAILKGICTWHFCYYKMTANGREVCQRERSALVGALYRLAEESNDPAERLGSMLLVLSNIFVEFNDLVNTLVQVTLFGLLSVEKNLCEMLDRTY